MIREANDEYLRDIQDGRVYQKFSQNEPHARGKRVYSIVMSCDGGSSHYVKELQHLATYVLPCGITPTRKVQV